MEVRVDSYVESPKGERNLINTAFLVEVAIDSKGMPAKVPRLMCRTQEEIEEFEAGLRRKKYRDEMSGELYR